VIAAIGVLRDIRLDTKSITVRKTPVLGRRQTAVKEGLTSIAADGFAVCRATRKHQYGARSRVPREGREHVPLVIVGKVEEAVPSQYAVETSIDPERTHVGNMPGLLRELPATMCNEP
jgi:hypothetical protein